jgi:hypothetical protein
MHEVPSPTKGGDMDDRSARWPELPYEAYAPTARLLLRGLQAVGKLTLLKPFEPQWAHVALLPTVRGLSTGVIPWRDLAFTVEADFIEHGLTVSASNGRTGGFAFGPMSVADFAASLDAALDAVGVAHRADPRPFEVPDPIPFPEDTLQRPYDRGLANAWWRALLSSYHALQVHHSRYLARTPPVGLLWGSSDLRDARYTGDRCQASGPDAAAIRRDSANELESSAGWWHGNDRYPRPAYFAYTKPAPAGIENAQIRPAAAHWEPSLGEFILDYDNVRRADDPHGALLGFFESTYLAGTRLAGWWNPSCADTPAATAQGA